MFEDGALLSQIWQLCSIVVIVADSCQELSKIIKLIIEGLNN